MIRRLGKQLATVLLAASLAGGAGADTEAAGTAEYLEANAAYVAEDYAQALSKYLEAADLGNADAQLMLGMMYSEGRGAPQNFAEATKWFTFAAEQGAAYHQHDLGFMYASGSRLPQNYTEAVKWYRLAAEQGYGSSQSELGLMYAKGQGVPQDNVMAYVWHSLAATGGHIVSENSRDIAAKQLTPEQLARAQEIAARCFKSNYKDCE